MNCVIKYRLALTTFLLLSMNSLASGQDLNYQSFAEQKIGKDKSGLILRDLGKAEWEILAVGNASIEQREGVSDAQGYREALLMAGAQSRRTLAEFIGGIRVKGFTAAKTESQVLVDGSQKENTQSKFSEFWKSQQQQDVYAFLRGTRQVGEWKSTDGRQVFLAVAVCPKDVSTSLEINCTSSNSPVVDKAESAANKGSDLKGRKVQMWGMAVKAAGSARGARNDAIYDALTLAVQSVAGVTVRGRTSAEHDSSTSESSNNTTNTVLSSRVHDRLKRNTLITTTGTVKSFRILEEQDLAGSYRVLVEADIQAILGSDVQLVLALLGDPLVAVQSSITVSSAKVNSIRAGLESKGLTVPRLPTRDDKYRDLLRQNRAFNGLSYEEVSERYRTIMLKEALESGVTILVWCEDNERLPSSVRVFSSVTGTRIRPVVPSSLESLDASKNQTDAVIVNSVVAYLEDEVFNGTHIKFELSNIENRQVKVLRETIEKLGKVVSIESVATDMLTKTAIFIVRYTGTVQEFVDSLKDEKSTDDNLKKLYIWRQVGNVVDGGFGY